MSIIKDFMKRPISSPPPSPPGKTLVPGTLQWTCNICGAANNSVAAVMERESGPCSYCGAVMRFRTLAAILTLRLFGEVKVLKELPPGSAVRGLGMSDADCYGNLLQQKFDYTNTYYHCEPLLDIVKPGEQWLGNNDFVITSDVFEHVPPPIPQAFANLLQLLKPGGVVIFSVPYTLRPDTTEHYPDLYEFTIRQDDQDAWVLDNVTRDGNRQQFRNLVFHGGPGSTLELRVFGRAALEHHFRAAGFTDIRIHREPYFEYGIFWLYPWSLVMSARRPE